MSINYEYCYHMRENNLSNPYEPPDATTTDNDHRKGPFQTTPITPSSLNNTSTTHPKPTSKFQKLKKRLSSHFECFSLSNKDSSISSEISDDNQNVEIIKFTAFDDVTDGHETVAHSDNNIPSCPSGAVPKPPPRSTSIYQLQQLHRMEDRTDHFETLMEHGQPATNAVIMRNKQPKANVCNRPKSDIFDLHKHQIKHENSEHDSSNNDSCHKEQHTRPMSMFFGGEDGRPVKHSISRFSAYEISSSNGFGRLDSYLKLDQLGEGSYATVYKGFSNVLNRVVALKEIRQQAEEGAPFTAIREASLLRGLKHANIVTLHDIVHTRHTLILVFEYVDTDLSQYLERHPGGLNANNVRLFMFQLLRGLAYCHERRILHRDLKPQNLLISKQGELKLADFGLARAKSIPSHTYSNEVVTLWYRPPDVLLGSRNYSTSLDMWGVGCIFIEMVSGAPAFPGVKDRTDQLDKIFRVFGTPDKSYWEEYQSIADFDCLKSTSYQCQQLSRCFPKLASMAQAEKLALGCLALEPRQRISSKQALEHAFFSELPSKLYQLPDHVPVIYVPGCSLLNENHNFPLSVMKIANKMKSGKN